MGQCKTFELIEFLVLQPFVSGNPAGVATSTPKADHPTWLQLCPPYSPL